MNQFGLLARYLARRFFAWVCIVLLALAAIVWLVGMIELLRRSSTREDATFGVVLQLAALKLPAMLELLLPFAVLFGSLFAFDRLARHNELTAAHGAGVSVWKLLLPALAVAFALGAGKVAIYGPLAAAAQSRFEQLETRYFSNAVPVSSLSQSGLWLREVTDGDLTILFAGRVGMGRILYDVVLYRYDGLKRFRNRLDAESAELRAGHWHLEGVWDAGSRNAPVRRAAETVATTLSWERIEDGLTGPTTMSVWNLPGYIHALEDAGFPARKHRLRLHALFASVVLTAAMLLIGATVSIRSRRRGGVAVMLAAGVGAGFLLFILSDVVFALGLSGRAPVVLAAWTPAAAAVMFGCAALLHLEDG